MRASPRTWPSIRRKRLSTDALAMVRIPPIYPLGVYSSRLSGRAPAGAVCKSYRSGLRDESRSREVATPPPARREPLSFLLGKLPDQIRSRAREISFPARPLAAIAVRHDLHLPDAPANSAAGARQLPDLRHGARARHRRRRDRPQSGIDRHGAAVLDRRRADRSSRRVGNGRARFGPRSSPVHFAGFLDLAPVAVRLAGRAMGRAAILRPRLG